MSGQKRAGWAIVRYIPSGAGCPEHEIGGNTRENWYACCPSGETFDGEYNWNPYCNTDSVMGNTTKQCANSTWSLWWSTDYFCCEPDLAGYYWQSDGSVGCWNKDWILQAQNNNSGAFLANSATNPPASKGGISSGAIAGAAIGGVCGAVVIVAIIWLLCRRRGRRVAAPNSSTTFTKLESTPPPDKEHYERTPVELENLYDGSARAEELPGWTMRQELSGQPPARELG